jgi:DNA-binding NarL/FixJ family response regulator
MRMSVLVVDDESEFRAQVIRLLALRGFEIAGQADDGAGALRMARLLEPGAVLLDVNLPDRSGLDVARELGGLRPAPRVLLTSADVDVADEQVNACGAAAFVAKDELPSSDLARLLGFADGPS